MDKTNIQKLFYIDKNYSKIKELLKESSESWSLIILGKIALYEKDSETAYQYFVRAKSPLGCIYCNLLESKFDKAKILLEIIKNSSPAIDWLNFLIKLLEGNKDCYTTYFQVRNFYEQDLELLFQYQKKDLIKIILEQNSYLEKFNKEIYKYSARVLLNNKIYDITEKYLQKSINIMYKDPETHFMLGELYLHKKDYFKAKEEFKKSNSVNGIYFPAIKKLEEISSMSY